MLGRAEEARRRLAGARRAGTGAVYPRTRRMTREGWWPAAVGVCGHDGPRVPPRDGDAAWGDRGDKHDGRHGTTLPGSAPDTLGGCPPRTTRNGSRRARAGALCAGRPGGPVRGRPARVDVRRVEGGRWAARANKKPPSPRRARRRDEGRRDPRGATLVTASRGRPGGDHSIGRFRVPTHPAYSRGILRAFFGWPLMSAFAGLAPSRASTLSRVAGEDASATTLTRRGRSIFGCCMLRIRVP